MAGRFKKNMTVEQLYPNGRCLQAADAAIDALPMTATLQKAVDAYDAAYTKAGGQSPWRKP
jgi:hypothetical protein